MQSPISILWLPAGGADILDGGWGVDQAIYNGSPAGVTVNLLWGGSASGGDAEGDKLISIEDLAGSDHSDGLFGDNGANSLYGVMGDDTLLGFGGPDRLVGGLGKDSLNGGDGADTLNGGKDGDTLFGGADADGAHRERPDRRLKGQRPGLATTHRLTERHDRIHHSKKTERHSVLSVHVCISTDAQAPPRSRQQRRSIPSLHGPSPYRYDL
jgi:RTX calcium-binding nonapeptide repeat (4 copies)